MRPDQFAADRAKLRELLVWMQHSDPSGLRRSIELEQPRIAEHFHDGTLGLRPRGRQEIMSLVTEFYIVLARTACGRLSIMM